MSVPRNDTMSTTGEDLAGMCKMYFTIPGPFLAVLLLKNWWMWASCFDLVVVLAYCLCFCSVSLPHITVVGHADVLF